MKKGGSPIESTELAYDGGKSILYEGGIRAESPLPTKMAYEGGGVNASSPIP